MTEKEILDGNILIADFMGWQSYWLHGGKKGNTVCPSMDRLYGYVLPKGLTQKTMNDEPFENVEYLRFHTSWDWLMPVVEKIEDMSDYQVAIEGCECEVYTMLKSERITTRHVVSERLGDSKIEGVYLTIIDFIKWYNEIEKL